MTGAVRCAPGRAGRLRRAGGRRAWLSITPEPERELPEAVAELRGNGLIEAERARVERLVMHGSRRAWAAYLAEAAELARGAPPGKARTIVLEVIDNHDNLKLGLQ
jgi:hypothetical protein